MKKKIYVVMLGIMIVLACMGLAACGTGGANTDATSDETTNSIYTDRDMDGTWDAATATNVELADSTGSYTIDAEGTYVFTGSLSDGQIIVKASDTAKVQVVLNGVSVTCKSAPALMIESGDKVFVTLAAGTENSLVDGTSYASTEDEPFACLFSKSDLTINGTGYLDVVGNYNNGIGSKDDLKICGGNITVTSVNHGIKGKDMVGICAGTVEVAANGDGIKSNNTTDEGRGYVSIDGGTVKITKCVEGIEARNIYINDGDISITSSDDGINATDGVTSSNVMQAQEGITIEITGGTLYINTGGDGIDSNGDLYISGGDVTIEGESNANEALDYAGEYNNTGGTVNTDGYVGGMGGGGKDGGLGQGGMNGPNGNFDDDMPDGGGFDGTRPQGQRPDGGGEPPA